MRKVLIALLLSLALAFGGSLVMPARSEVRSNVGSVTVSFTVPETAKMTAVLSPDQSTWLVAVDTNLIHAPHVVELDVDGVRYDRECDGEPCQEPLTAQGSYHFEIPVKAFAEGKQGMGTLTLVIV